MARGESGRGASDMLLLTLLYLLSCTNDEGNGQLRVSSSMVAVKVLLRFEMVVVFSSERDEAAICSMAMGNGDAGSLLRRRALVVDSNGSFEVDEEEGGRFSDIDEIETGREGVEESLACFLQS